MSAEEAAFGQWIIVFDPARLLIGRVDPGASEGKPYMTLFPCYELIDSKQMVGERIQNIVEVQPLAGCLFDVPVQVSDGNLTCIDLAMLSDHDKRMLEGRIASLRAQLVEKRSGIKLVTSISNEKH